MLLNKVGKRELRLQSTIDPYFCATQGHSNVWRAAFFACIVGHRVFLVFLNMTFGREPLRCDSEADQHLPDAVGLIAGQPKIGRGITRAVGITADPDANAWVSFHDFGDIPKLVT